MKRAIHAVAILFALAPLCTAQMPPEEAGTFEDRVLLELSTEFGRALFKNCELTVHLPQYDGPATSRLACTLNTTDGELIEASAEITDEQESNLREMLREAKLFGSGHTGTDKRGVCGIFQILTIGDQGITVAIVISGNPTFSDPGPRKTLLDWLDAQEKTLYQAWQDERKNTE